MSFLVVNDVSRLEGERTTVHHVSFSLEASQKLVIAGGTGSGKTSLLKMIAGLLQPSSGTIYFRDKKIKGPQEQLMPGHPRIAYQSQFFELRNHYRVEEILSMTSKMSSADMKLICEVCRITSFLHRWSHELSGGEKQRVALAKQLLTAPELLLLDEPFSNLDLFHKSVLKEVIGDISDRLSVTCVLVSHDPQDTLPWADEVLVLENGSIIQKGSPEQIFYHPVKAYTASLFGAYTPLSPSLADLIASHSANNALAVPEFIRPSQWTLQSPGEGMKGSVERKEFMGPFVQLHIYIDDIEIVVHTMDQKIQVGDIVYLRLASGSATGVVAGKSSM